ncbi:Myosin-6 [Camellia lanceoleosa]|uniref:Myosin-6 n=1 Tax=Camellia lanceoleosa TaxID=1840588 RepID=A0ACC0FL36_9ERIC|nr:Myosin-6 [Camellia lanceoleosa]
MPQNDLMKYFREDLHRRLLSTDFKKQIDGIEMLHKAQDMDKRNEAKPGEARAVFRRSIRENRQDPMKRPKRIVDVGCGIGGSSRYLARKYEAQCQGITLSPIQAQMAEGQLAREVYENIRREASCLRIQRDFRMHLARKAYKELCSSAVSIQAGMRGMVARDEHHFRR